MKGLILEEITKTEIISAIKDTVNEELLVLMTSSEVADLLGVSLTTVAAYKNDGRLKDYSQENEHRKFSARDVLKMRRAKYLKH